MTQTCEHSGCEFGNREEYCTVEAADPAGDIEVIASLLEDIVYEPVAMTDDAYRIRGTSAGLQIERSFEYLVGNREANTFPTEIRLAVNHRAAKTSGLQSYQVIASWRPYSTEKNDWFSTQYFIDTYAEGEVQAAIDELDVTTGMRATRPMTGYDYQQLFAALAEIDSVHFAELADNSRAG